ncbi:hypothetical protein RCO27_04470 [Sphingosinicella sp. LHD-64]|uniref:hypothetical protein n=1 Tax=Sphingosinicella sp. LHD-64 TaxID=3072139 RepID=UPI00280FB3E8|nr:hypothetical protein [Sphingosinicella sp. LHD-64]MDQ8755476.1 hypothetical protein [Sphingosinicella sp. LHD-64]
MSIIAGSALFVAACGGSETTVNAGAANDLESNLMLDTPGNDASAMESVTNVVEPLPTANVGEADGNVLGETSGGDTGGETVDSNVAGM